MKKRTFFVLAAAVVLTACAYSNGEPPMSEWPRPKSCMTSEALNDNCCLDDESNDRCILRLTQVIRRHSLSRKEPSQEMREKHRQLIQSFRVESGATIPPPAPTSSTVLSKDPVQPVPWSTGDGVSLE